jgi:hypothetical protein
MNPSITDITGVVYDIALASLDSLWKGRGWVDFLHRIYQGRPYIKSAWARFSGFDLKTDVRGSQCGLIR